ncbi:DUF4883 family protein [Clostridium rectalis]|uniref:DUF4883 family protein n=1 Tax=Clostridium rectalis TaxID=2040295 RepID=UPI000F635AC3|nr:DUF4883 family protein [Clostridium rectalis]
MKKKYTYIFIILISIALLFASCNLPINKKTKQNNFYYTDELYKNINSETSYKCSIVDTNFYKEKNIDSNDFSIINNFMKNLDIKYFTSKPKNLPSKPSYKIFLTFKNETFVINIYDKKYVSVHPWDGYFDMDYIDMSFIPESYNLYELCNYVIPR